MHGSSTSYLYLFICAFVHKYCLTFLLIIFEFHPISNKSFDYFGSPLKVDFPELNQLIK